MNRSRIARATAWAAAGWAPTAIAATIAGTVTVPAGEVYSLPGLEPLTVLAGGMLDAAPAVSGSAISLNGQVLNQGTIRAFFGTEVNGVSFYGPVTNERDIVAHTLNIFGSFVNGVDGVVSAGSYPLNGQPVTFTETDSFGANRALPGLGWLAGGGATVTNNLRWYSAGNASLLGIFDNHGELRSENSANTLPVGGVRYGQVFTIGTPGVGGGLLRNYDTVVLGRNTDLQLWGQVLNGVPPRTGARFMVQGARVQVNPTGRFVNDEMLEITDGGEMHLLPSAGAMPAMIQGGVVDVQSGRFVNNSSQALYNMVGARFLVGAAGRYEEAGIGFQNDGAVEVAGAFQGTSYFGLGTMAVASGGVVDLGSIEIQRDSAGRRGELLVAGRVEAGFITNQGWLKIASTGVVQMRDGPLRQEVGELIVDGTFNGGLDLAGGLLWGVGRINGDLFVGGLAGALQEPPFCHAIAFACFRPGNSPGTFTVDGALAFLEGGVLQLEIVSTPTGLAWDQVFATEMSFATGSLIEISVGPGVSLPAAPLTLLACSTGCSFDGAEVIVLGADASQLRFSSTGLVFAPVPEPGTWALWLMGCVGLVGPGLRRRPLPH